MARELGRFYWTMLSVWVLSRHYFRAAIVEWEITTVITMKTLVFDVATLEVRTIIDEGFVYTANLIKVVLPKPYTVNYEHARDDGLLLIFIL